MLAPHGSAGGQGGSSPSQDAAPSCPCRVACPPIHPPAGFGKYKKEEEPAEGTAAYPAGAEPYGRPYMLHTTYSNVPGASFEGQAVR